MSVGTIKKTFDKNKPLINVLPEHQTSSLGYFPSWLVVVSLREETGRLFIVHRDFGCLNLKCLD